MLTVKKLRSHSEEILGLLLQYKQKHWKEQTVLPIFFGYLHAKHPGHISKEQRLISAAGWAKKRIDLHHRGANPLAIELAVRPAAGSAVQQLDAENNRDELRKLSRLTKKQAKTSVLVLLDCRKTPKDKAKAQAQYARISLGRGRYTRRAVRVLYIHRDVVFDFLWVP